MKYTLSLRQLFKHSVIAASGRTCGWGGRLAGAQAWQTEREHVRNSVRGLTLQSGQMRYNERVLMLKRAYTMNYNMKH